MCIYNVWETEITRRIKNRHYNLKMAYISIKLKDTSEMHQFSYLAELEQKHIDDFLTRFPNYDLSKCIKRPNF